LQTSSALHVSSWTSGALVAKNMRLEDLAAELSRYRQGWLLCDPAVSDLRVSGVFQLEHIDQALQGLSQTLAVRIERRTRFWTRIVAV
ncbi:MAG: FecR domain-containing protein, partial [Pseudomonas helleri]